MIPLTKAASETSIAVVVPTIRDSIHSFLEAWGPLFDAPNVKVYVIEDRPERQLQFGQPNIQSWAWADIDLQLGGSKWIIPRQTDCVRSFGFWQAFIDKADVIVSLDDDTAPLSHDTLSMHAENLTSQLPSPAWTNTLTRVIPRGMPYYNLSRNLPIVISHGLWEGNLDLDAVMALASHRVLSPLEQLTPTTIGRNTNYLKEQIIPVGSYYPMCGMNVAFNAHITPLMYFMLMGKDYPYDRFGDIWAGIVSKKVLDHFGFGVRSGTPHVKHLRASNAWVNLRKEAAVLAVHEDFWQTIDAIHLNAISMTEAYRQIAKRIPVLNGGDEYFTTLGRAMLEWVELFE